VGDVHRDNQGRQYSYVAYRLPNNEEFDPVHEKTLDFPNVGIDLIKNVPTE